MRKLLALLGAVLFIAMSATSAAAYPWYTDRCVGCTSQYHTFHPYTHHYHGSYTYGYHGWDNYKVTYNHRYPYYRYYSPYRWTYHHAYSGYPYTYGGLYW